jgi:ATP-dependent DNA helicase PIF1
MPNTRQFGEFNRRLPKQGKPTGQRPKFQRDEAYERSPGVSEALTAIDAGSPVALVVGRAGTGKTRLVRYLRDRPGGERQAVVAPTAIAALNAQAQTIHSLFKLPPLLLDAKALPEERGSGVLYRRMKRLVIDEISMVRVDLIDAIDARLRAIRGNDRPFGGVQIVMVGDFLQLPPVVESDHRPLLHGLGYRTPYAFSARALEHVPVTTVSLEHVYRQDEKEFIDILSQIRVGEGIPGAVTLLNERCVGPHRTTALPLLLTPTKAAAERYNQRGLNALASDPVLFSGEITGRLEIDRDRLPVPEHLELRIGARVMAVKNDPEGRWYNGSLGTVKGIDEGGVFVRFDRSGVEHLVSGAEWTKVRQEWNEESQSIENRQIGAYRQIPLLHAWAITIHKAQGLTLDDVRLDLGSGAFAPGQVYVALSRVRTLAGLSLARPLRPTEVQADPMLLGFMEWAHTGRGTAQERKQWPPGNSA